MGSCGYRQPAASQSKYTSHNLCPIYYNLSFKHVFLAVPKSNPYCAVSNPAKYWPDGFKLGYREHRKRYTHVIQCIVVK